MSDEKKEIRFKKAFMGGFKRQSVADYIEGLQKELFESRAAAAKAVKDFEEYHVKESIRQQKAAFEADENVTLRRELEEIKAKLAEAQAQASAASVAPPADTSAFEAELERERKTSESLRLDVAELKKQLSEEYSANELLAAAVGEKNEEIAALNEKVAVVTAVDSAAEIESIRAEAAAQIEKTRAEAAAEVESAKAEAEKAKAEAAAEIESIKAEAADEVDKLKAEAFAEVEKVKAEALAELEKAETKTESIKAELEEARRLADEAREKAESNADAVVIPGPVIEEAAETEDAGKPETATTDESLAPIVAAPAAEAMPREIPMAELEQKTENIMPQEVPTKAPVAEAGIPSEASSAADDAVIGYPDKKLEAPVTESVAEPESAAGESVAWESVIFEGPETVPSEEPKAAVPEAPKPVSYEAPKSAVPNIPKVYDKEKIADIIARYSKIRNKSENK